MFSLIGDRLCPLNFRLGFVLMAMAAVIMFTAFLLFPESYRWLTKKDHQKKALASLKFFLKDPQEATTMLEHVQQLMQKEVPSAGTLSGYILSMCVCACNCLLCVPNKKSRAFLLVLWSSILSTIIRYLSVLHAVSRFVCVG